MEIVWPRCLDSDLQLSDCIDSPQKVRGQPRWSTARLGDKEKTPANTPYPHLVI